MRYIITFLAAATPALGEVPQVVTDIPPVHSLVAQVMGDLGEPVLLLERGAENPVIQTVLNNLPLERGGEVAPPAQTVDIERLLPGDRRYYAYMGSLTTPPCTEDVLWLVLKAPQPISAEQLSIFQRLYPANARPVQPGFARIIKESR